MFTPAVRRSLVGLSVGMLLGVAVVQAVIALQGNEVTLLSQLVLAVVALGYGAYLFVERRQLQRVRYGSLAAHVIGYVTVNGSYWLHAGFLWATGQGSAIDASWYGPLFGMSLLWGLGLTVHIIASIAGRGFDDARIA